MILSFTSIDSDKVEDDPEQLLGYEAISFFLTIPPDDHDDCQRLEESSVDRRETGFSNETKLLKRSPHGLEEML
jgi:hypothetical protein